MQVSDAALEQFNGYHPKHTFYAVLGDMEPTDGRANALHATQAGRQIHDKSVKAVTAHEAALLKSIATEMYESIVAALVRIQEDLFRTSA